MLRQDAGLALVYADGVIFGDSEQAGRRLMEVSPSEGEVTFEKLVRRRAVVHTCTTVVRREAVLRAGGFDEAVKVVEDVDLWLRIVKDGGRIGYQRRPLGRYCRRAGSLSSNPVEMIESYLGVLEKIGRHPAVTAMEREAIERERVVERALLDLYEGKAALARGDMGEARRRLERANRHWRRWKLAVLVMGLRVAPWLVRALSIRAGRH
jgi:hypothetical protein